MAIEFDFDYLCLTTTQERLVSEYYKFESGSRVISYLFNRICRINSTDQLEKFTGSMSSFLPMSHIPTTFLPTKLLIILLKLSNGYPSIHLDIQLRTTKAPRPRLHPKARRVQPQPLRLGANLRECAARQTHQRGRVQQQSQESVITIYPFIQPIKI
jgi:hypothetical protein